jgi:hypothetical protein
VPKLIGALVQVAIGKLPPLKKNRSGIRGSCHLLLEQLVYADVKMVGPGIVPLIENSSPLSFCQCRGLYPGFLGSLSAGLRRPAFCRQSSWVRFNSSLFLVIPSYVSVPSAPRTSVVITCVKGITTYASLEAVKTI